LRALAGLHQPPVLWITRNCNYCSSSQPKYDMIIAKMMERCQAARLRKGEQGRTSSVAVKEGRERGCLLSPIARPTAVPYPLNQRCCRSPQPTRPAPAPQRPPTPQRAPAPQRGPTPFQNSPTIAAANSRPPARCSRLPIMSNAANACDNSIGSPRAIWPSSIARVNVSAMTS